MKELISTSPALFFMIAFVFFMLSNFAIDFGTISFCEQSGFEQALRVLDCKVINSLEDTSKEKVAYKVKNKFSSIQISHFLILS